jgi:DNA-binding beta-propeller fold protein YncE
MRVTAGPQPSAARAFSLLANNHLLVVDIVSGATLAELTLAPRGSPISEVHSMGLSGDRKQLFALASDDAGRAVVAAIDTTALKISATWDPGGGPDYRGLAVGPRTGRLYLFANRGAEPTVRVLDPSGQQPIQEWQARPANGRTWLIYQGSVAPDESAMFISYHGPDTTGIDRFAIGASGLTRCALAAAPDSGCFRTHGSFALGNDDLFAATGEPVVFALDPSTGARRSDYDMRLDGNHLMEFAIAPTVGRLYAVGSCGYTGGLSVADLATHQTEILSASRALGAPCGERIAVLDDGSLLVVAKTARPVPDLSAGSLVVFSGAGEPLRTIPTPAEAIDLLLFK